MTVIKLPTFLFVFSIKRNCIKRTPFKLKEASYCRVTKIQGTPQTSTRYKHLFSFSSLNTQPINRGGYMTFSLKAPLGEIACWTGFVLGFDHFHVCGYTPTKLPKGTKTSTASRFHSKRQIGNPWKQQNVVMT